MGGLLPISNGGDQKGLQKNLFYRTIYASKKYKIIAKNPDIQYQPIILKIYSLINGTSGYDILPLCWYFNSDKSRMVRLGRAQGIRAYYKLNEYTNIREFIISTPNNAVVYIEFCSTVEDKKENILFEETEEDISTWTEVTDN